MTRSATVVVAVVLTAALLSAGIPVWPVEAHSTGYGDERVALLQCEADGDGRLQVLAGSVTYETQVRIYIGGDCADTVADLLRAGMSISHSQAAESHENVSFNFVFLGARP